MRLNKRTIAVSTAALTIVGGAAFAYIATTGSGSGSGSVAEGTIEITNISTSELVLDEAGDVTFDAAASGQPERITAVAVEADTENWDETTCGVSANLVGGETTLTSPVDLVKDAPATSVTVEGAVTLANDNEVDQSECAPAITVTVNP